MGKKENSLIGKVHQAEIDLSIQQTIYNLVNGMRKGESCGYDKTFRKRTDEI